MLFEFLICLSHGWLIGALDEAFLIVNAVMLVL